MWGDFCFFAERYINMNDYGKDNPTPQTSDGAEKSIRSFLAEASVVSSRAFESIQALAGTTFSKGVQINALRKFAIENDCWFPDASVLGEYADRGSENEVYTSRESDTVFKLNDFRYADDNLNSFFDRIEIHNLYFPDCQYDLIGFGLNSLNNCCAILSQPFIHAEREATNEEIAEALTNNGFLPQLGGEYFSNGEYDIFDALPNNVLYGTDGHLYFIDTIIFHSEEQNFNVYKTLSPRYGSGNSINKT